MVRIKICGLTSKESAWAAVEAGADAVGFVFASGRRRVSPDHVREIIRSIPPYVTTTGVFVDADLNELNHIAEYCQLDVLQLHGNESPEYCKLAVRPIVKTLHIHGEEHDLIGEMNKYKPGARAILLDTYVAGESGGTGKAFPWEHVKELHLNASIILAGGLHSGNVASAILQTNPFAVDVSSGVETNGVKDSFKMEAFVRAVRECHVAQRFLI
ncbi:phosphoribosylanthranilate isomerase [Paenibacillus pini]|uniref:N-(5'-phosphoribosyl)anthranilate isomerase n=1 Tax=Paenibacillus pini JCM 16418 TaxID=1236976 RepID=W7YH33_9BACL|nr:phosphoribosylanthranilate isomerase [Paenibacillus pini]GAF06918.1 phosphoribosylanthranilate isomerase [Paenibacillus pini JCM 16418]